MGGAVSATTRLLGTDYPGQPMFGSLALHLCILEREGKADEARKLLAAHNRIRKCFGHPPVNLAAQFTTAPMEGLLTVPAMRDIDRVVTRTVGEAA